MKTRTKAQEKLKPKIAALFAIAILSGCAPAWGQGDWMNSMGFGYGSFPSREDRLKERQRRALEEQKEQQVEALQRERQAVIDRVCLRFPRPIDPSNLIIDGKFYAEDTYPKPSGRVIGRILTISGRTMLIRTLRAQSVNQASINSVPNLHEGGYRLVPGVVQVGTDLLPDKEIVLLNCPKSADRAVGETISMGAWQVGTTNYHGEQLQLWDCGLVDTVENRIQVGIPIPTPEQTAAANQAITTAFQELADQKAAARQQAEDDRAARREATLARSVAIYQEAAAAGEGLSQLRLGEIYLRGEGVETNAMLARKWLSAALTNGYTQAKKLLAEIEPRPKP